MVSERDAKKELGDLRSEVKRLKEDASRRAWEHPNGIIKRALDTLEFFRGFYGGGVGSREPIQEVVKIIDAAAMHRAAGGSQAYGEGLLYGFARLIEDVYLGGNEWHKEAHAEANRRRINENRKPATE